MTALPEDSWLLSYRPQPEPVTAEQYEDLPEEISKRIEVVAGYIVNCESPSIEHNKALWRLADLIGRAAKAAMALGHACLDVNIDVDMRLQDVPLTTRRPDIALHRCLDRKNKARKDKERLRAGHALLVVEIVSPGSEMPDTNDKPAEYASAGIPHYWIVRFDDVSVTTIDRYELDSDAMLYKHMGTFMKGEDGGPPEVELPIPMKIDWTELEY